MIWRNPRFVRHSPIVTTVLLEWANVNQMVRMWRWHTAAGQSLIAWCSVNLALWIWANYYRVMIPDEKLPQQTIKVGIALNTGVILSVIWFRYLA